MRGCSKDRERTLNWEKKKAVEELTLRLGEANDGEAVANDGVNKCFDEIAHYRQSGVLLTTNDATDAVDGVADSAENGAEVLRLPAIFLEDDAEVAEGIALRELLVAEEELGRREARGGPI